MAKRIATVSGTALIPGVSRNGRLYTPEMIAKAVERAQDRIADGSRPLTMLTHHGADDDSTRIVGTVTGLSLESDGSARFTADIADTDHGRTIASLVSTKDGPPVLRGVSMRGAWVGRTRRERYAGQLVETADDLELDGLDYTRKPGIAGAEIDRVDLAEELPAESADGRHLIYESAEAVVTFTEDAGVVEAVADFKANTKPAGVTASDYADPGYQADKKKRYPLDTKARAKSAWSYINQGDNAKAYTGPQLKRIKQRIMKALKRFGVTVTAESWLIDTITESVPAAPVAEEMYGVYGDQGPGSFCLNATNGPVSVTVSSYCVDPADLELVLHAAVDGAAKALAAIDPDMDGDMDVPGATAEDSDDDMESAPTGDTLVEAEPGPETPAAEAVEDHEDPAPEAAADHPTEKEEPAMAEPTTAVEATTAATDTPPQQAPEISDAAMDKLADRIGGALAAALGALVPKTPAVAAETAPAPATVEETAPPPSAPAETVTETDNDRIQRLVAEGIEQARTRIVQEMVEAGNGPTRKGLVSPVNEHTAPAATEGWPEGWPTENGSPKPLHKWTENERREHAFPALEQYVLGNRSRV